MITEDQILISTTKKYLEETPETQATFAVNKLFPALREAGFKAVKKEETVDDVYKNIAAMKTWIGRILNTDREIPLKWKWVWLSCLPSPYRERCLHELSSLAQSTVPSLNGLHAAADVGALAKESGEAISAMAIIASDGVYDHQDDPEAVKHALNELYDLRDSAQAQIDAIEAMTGHKVRRSRVTVTHTKTMTIEQF